ncbi:Crp/Fnr family transcriptional regulator [Aquabacterium sp. A7-Y]|uniref:Crp/Fnr family transcriptional regulator n=1 Tax=Aquabacterium sp. A7-Y TaxID=1349605 RepID=UPI00223CB4CB|nr:Crp/Fnr family transcriptional regulator [Aquabacterium sp. A7-Y]MCW7541126.1 Crp/Fnr family transcriptional regulator [Aquabacterium sp. A7-Y]
MELSPCSAASGGHPLSVGTAKTPRRLPAQASVEAIADTLRLLEERLPIHRRVVHAGDCLYRAGERFERLSVLHSGLFKLVDLTADGREQVVALHFKGDWMGFDGIASGRYGCEAVAMDTGEVWTFRYDSLIRACTDCPALLNALHAAMSREMVRDRDFQMTLCTLPVDARVAEFLRYWIDALIRRGQRTDRLTLRMSRAEIGSYLGMTLESVSRAFSRLAREQVIRFESSARREVHIPDLGALEGFVLRSLVPNAKANRHLLKDVAVVPVMGNRGAANAVAEISQRLGRTPLMSSAFTAREVEDGSCMPRLRAFGRAVQDAEGGGPVRRAATWSPQSA